MILYSCTKHSLDTVEGLKLSELKAILLRKTNIRLCRTGGNILSNNHDLKKKGAAVMSKLGKPQTSRSRSI